MQLKDLKVRTPRNYSSQKYLNLCREIRAEHPELGLGRIVESNIDLSFARRFKVNGFKLYTLISDDSLSKKTGKREKSWLLAFDDLVAIEEQKRTKTNFDYCSGCIADKVRGYKENTALVGIHNYETGKVRKLDILKQVTIHELYHLLGLEDCLRHNCVMHREYFNSEFLCDRCDTEAKAIARRYSSK